MLSKNAHTLTVAILDMGLAWDPCVAQGGERAKLSSVLEECVEEKQRLPATKGAKRFSYDLRTSCSYPRSVCDVAAYETACCMYIPFAVGVSSNPEILLQA